MKIFLKTEDEIDLMRNASRLVGATLGELVKHINPGLSITRLDSLADAFIRDNGAVPVKRENPCVTVGKSCTFTLIDRYSAGDRSLMDATLKDGEFMSVECGLLLDGFYGFSSYTFSVGAVQPKLRKKLRTVKKTLLAGVDSVVAGKHISDIHDAARHYAERRKSGLAYRLEIQGIGREICESPYDSDPASLLLKNGMCMTLKAVAANWNVAPLASFAHTVVVRRGKAEILSSFREVEQIEGKQLQK